MFFRLSSFELGLLIFGIVLGTTLLGVVAGRRLRAHADTLREPFGVLQAALLGLVALILAFGLTLAVGRYDARRAAVVDDCERDRHDVPARADAARAGAHAVPRRSSCATPTRRSASRKRSRAARRPATRSRTAERLQRSLWRLAGEALAGVADRQRAAPLRRDAERDDRHADRAGLGAEQPRPQRRARDRGRRRRRRARPARALPGDPLAGRGQRRPRGRVRLGAAAHHLRPRPAGARASCTVPDTPLVDLRASMELPPAAEARRSVAGVAELGG